jgi:hypothetical protein
LQVIESVFIGAHPWLKFFAPPPLCVNLVGLMPEEALVQAAAK